jgi:regulator of sigma E protease
LLFVVLEKVLGKKVKPAFEQSTHQIGMIILLILIALISVNDILRLARGG